MVEKVPANYCAALGEFLSGTNTGVEVSDGYGKAVGLSCFYCVTYINLFVT